MRRLVAHTRASISGPKITPRMIATSRSKFFLVIRPPAFERTLRPGTTKAHDPCRPGRELKETVARASPARCLLRNCVHSLEHGFKVEALVLDGEGPRPL